MLSKILVALLLGCSLAGCAVVEQKLGHDITQVARPDVAQALADAKAAGDADGAACWQDWLDFTDSLQVPTAPKVVGLVSALEAGRITANQAPVVLPAKLHKDCAVVLVDANVIAAKLGIAIGGAVAGGQIISAGAALQGQAAALKAAQAALMAKP